MKAILTSQRLIRLVLVLYVMTLGVAMASPMVSPQSMNLVCTATGFKVVDASSSSPDQQSKNSGLAMKHLLDCPLCVPASLAADFSAFEVPAPVHSLSYALQSIPAARLASIVSAPLPARGPPGFQ